MPSPPSAVKDFVRRLHNYFYQPNGHAKPTPPHLDIAAQIETIRNVETKQDLGLGKRIHGFRFLGLELRLDRDVLGMYRVTVNQGRERQYSFTIVCEPGDYDALRAGYQEITQFLQSDRHLANLPNHERVKGHFYGH